MWAAAARSQRTRCVAFQRQVEWKRLLMRDETTPAWVLGLVGARLPELSGVNLSLCLRKLGSHRDSFERNDARVAALVEACGSRLEELGPRQLVSAGVGLARLGVRGDLARRLSRRVRARIRDLDAAQVVSLTWSLLTLRAPFGFFAAEIERRIDEFEPGQLCALASALRDYDDLVSAVARRAAETDAFFEAASPLEACMFVSAAWRCHDVSAALEVIDRRRASLSPSDLATALKAISDSAPPGLLDAAVRAFREDPRAFLDPLDTPAFARVLSALAQRAAAAAAASKKKKKSAGEFRDAFGAALESLKSRPLDELSQAMLARIALAVSHSQVFDPLEARVFLDATIKPLVVVDDDLRARDATRFATGFARCGAGDAGFFGRIARHLAVDALPPLGLAQAAWAFALTTPPSEARLDLLSRVSRSARSRLHEFSPSELQFLSRALAEAKFNAPALAADIASALRRAGALFDARDSPSRRLGALAARARDFAVVGACAPDLYDHIAAEARRALGAVDRLDLSTARSVVTHLGRLATAFSALRLAPDGFFEAILDASRDALLLLQEDRTLTTKAVLDLLHACAISGVSGPIVDPAWRVLRRGDLSPHQTADLHAVYRALQMQGEEEENTAFFREVEVAALVAAQKFVDARRAETPPKHKPEISASLRRLGLYEFQPHLTDEGFLLDFADLHSRSAVLVAGRHAYLHFPAGSGGGGGREPASRPRYVLKGVHHFRATLLRHLGWNLHIIPFFKWISLGSDADAEDAFLQDKLAPHWAGRP
ncbi:hypothetical protein CTAYLR_001448 [Chrysophaeum taylorii]|uniref:RAP domain-containing protein n=1 Tax=Chrysophaeum taylorii TaxID=2483200 RepID=A0AAD7UB01_9STRA|nr:hypothetical protein CTAYLR_001448 [Chrysophaeum taylorii]